MAHEITETDNVVLHKQAAWHGLGTIVDKAPTPLEALTLAGLEWEVEQREMYTEVMVADPDTGRMKPTMIEIPNSVANYRSDTGEFLGIVGSNYKVINNREVAEFAMAIGEEEVVRVETAGSIRGGKKVWFLLKGDAFEVGNGDTVYKYLLLSNGHDGLAPYRVTPTSIRVVCSNTLHAVIPRGDSGELGTSAFVLKHTTNIMDRLLEVKAALKEYGKKTTEMEERAQSLAKAQAKADDYKKFFFDCYTHDFGEVNVNPKDAKEERRYNRALDAYSLFSRRFDDEKVIAGTGWWTAFNAYSGLIQHDKKARGKTDIERVRNQQNSNLFGLNADRTVAALSRACQMAGVA